MSTQRRIGSSCLIAALVVIGCGGGKPQDASARTDTAPEAPRQLAEAPAGAPAAGSAAVTGIVVFQGTAPGAEKVKMDADPVCKQQHAGAVMTERVVVNANGTLRNVFVYVKSGLRGTYPAPTAPVVLNQQGCWYVPHVFGLQAGQPLEIVNSDATLHNINAKPTANQAFNIAQPVQHMKTQKKFTKPEIGVKFKCNVHPWMSAYAGVVEHPFYGVTGEDGAFALPGLPAGTYTIEAWHEQYGAKTADVTVGAGESRTLEFTFSP